MERRGYSEGCSWWIRRTACGRVSIPTRHALKFARPCATCWPEIRAQLALFGGRRRERIRETQKTIQEALIP